MKPSKFGYAKARSVEHALALLAESSGGAKVLAGGQSLVPMMNYRVAAPAMLIDINGLQELSYIRSDGAHLHIGGLTRHDTLARSSVAREACPLISQAYEFIAHQTIRNRGTIGGNLSHADPASEMPAVMLSLNATMTLRSGNGFREVAAEDFFVDTFTTALEDHELLTEISIPVLSQFHRTGFLEVSPRKGDFAICGVSVVLALSEGLCSDVRIACCGVAGRPERLKQAETWMEGKLLSPELIAETGGLAAAAFEPLTDAKATGEYRKTLMRVMVVRLLTQMLAECGLEEIQK